MVKEVNVTGKETFAYIRDQLGMGTYLAERINALPIEDGSVYALVPEEASAESVFNFQYGGLYPFDRSALLHTNVLPVLNESRPLILNFFLEHLENDTENRVIFVDFLSLPDDKGLTNSGLQYNWFGAGEVYYLFSAARPDKGQIEMALQISESYAFLCVLSKLGSDKYSKVEPFKEIDINLLKELAGNVSKFYVKAYDGEGFLKWERPPNLIDQ